MFVAAPSRAGGPQKLSDCQASDARGRRRLDSRLCRLRGMLASWNKRPTLTLSGIIPARRIPMGNGNLEGLFVETLKDIFYAEKQILRALPKMAREAKSPELKKAFETHRE